MKKNIKSDEDDDDEERSSVLVKSLFFLYTGNAMFDSKETKRNDQTVLRDFV